MNKMNISFGGCHSFRTSSCTYVTASVLIIAGVWIHSRRDHASTRRDEAVLRPLRLWWPSRITVGS